MVKWRKYKKPQLYKLCCHDYRILIIATQIKPLRGQLISRIHTKTAQKIFVGVGKKNKTLEKVNCRVLWIPITVLPHKKLKDCGTKSKLHLWNLTEKSIATYSFHKTCTFGWCFLAQSFSINFIKHKDIDNFCILLNFTNAIFLFVYGSFSTTLLLLMRIEKMKGKKRQQIQTYMRHSKVKATQSNSHAIILAN